MCQKSNSSLELNAFDMSSHTNNTQPTSRRPNNPYTWYDNGHQVNMDMISPPSRPFPSILNEGVVVDPWLLSLQDGIFTLPPNIMSFPRPRMQLIVIGDNLANNNLRSRQVHDHARQRDSELIPAAEQKKALEKLRREIYNPIPKKIIQRLGRFSKENSARKTNMSEKKDKQVKEEEEDDDKKCVICLEDFQVKEVVMVTPCNHMFHEECILPWVKSHGKCPVCRFLLFEKSETSSTNSNNLVNDRSINNLITFLTSRGSSTTNEPSWF